MGFYWTGFNRTRFVGFTDAQPAQDRSYWSLKFLPRPLHERYSYTAFGNLLNYIITLTFRGGTSWPADLKNAHRIFMPPFCLSTSCHISLRLFLLELKNCDLWYVCFVLIPFVVPVYKITSTRVSCFKSSPE